MEELLKKKQYDQDQEYEIDHIHYGNRKRNQELRERRFYLTREKNDLIFNDIMLRGLDHKRRRIKEQIKDATTLGGYAPAGMGTA